MQGETISHYRILEKIGEGGMGVVYKAEDTRLQRIVALKFLTPESMRDQEAKLRFLNEARAAAALDHPNICTVHEIDEADGRTFMAMAFVEGQSLKETIRSGPLDLGEAIDHAIGIADGLAAAHEGDVIHRDIKPANIMLSTRGQPQIMDFGLARAESRTQLTKEGTTLGTIDYMSPEQARGEETTHLTDIWSLGVVIYEMTCGRTPFRADRQQAVVHAILNVDPTPLTGLRTGVPILLDQIVSKCLTRTLEERYQTVADLLADLRRLKRQVDSETDQAAEQETVRVATPIRTPARIGRRQWLPGVLVLVVLIAAIITIRFVGLPSGDETDSRTMLVILPFENMGAAEDEYFADGITEEITSRLATLPELGVISRTSAIQYKNTSKTIRQIGEELGVAYVLEGTVRWDHTGGDASRVRVTPQLIRVDDDTHLWSERYDGELTNVFGIQSAIAVQVVEQLGINLLESGRQRLNARPTDNMEAYEAYLRGLNANKVNVYSEVGRQLVIQMFERATTLDSTFALAWAELSKAHSQLLNLRMDLSPERHELAMDAAEKAFSLQPDLPEAHMALGYYYYWGLGDYGKALEQFAIAETARPNDSGVIQAAGWIKRRQGQWQESIDHAERALELNPRDAQLMRELANNHFHVRRFETAIEYYDRSIALAPDQQAAYVLKAMACLSASGDFERARAVLEEIPAVINPFVVYYRYYVELLDRNYQVALEQIESQPFDIFGGQDNIAPREMLTGFARHLMGQRDAARQDLETALATLEVLEAQQPNDHRVHGALGIVHAYLGHDEDAVREGRKAVELLPVSKDALHGPVQNENLAFIYALIGDYDTAVSEIEYLMSIPYRMSLASLRLDPRWDSLRELPRFRKLLERTDTGE